MAFSKIMTQLKIAAKMLPELWDAIDNVTPSDSRAFFAAAGYEPE